ncbi:MAG TPA: hypothetical protein VHX88_08880 [Solirubrobacteraceae bacterium]|jgi:hypothetical protein|nr:hypothetical protein [Solirubrobacteraceae bacterium]
MSRRLARAIVHRLYPRGFRRRYGDELDALLEDAAPGPLAVLDLLRGALVMRVRAPRGLSEELYVGERLRGGVSALLACWVLFCAAAFGFYKDTEGQSSFGDVHRHEILGGAHLVVLGLASLAVLLGAAPLVLAVLGHARRSPGRVRWLTLVPPLAVGAFAVLTDVLALAHAGRPAAQPTVAGRGAFAAWGLAGLACGAVCVVAARSVLYAVPVAGRRLLAAMACGTVVTGAMVAITAAVAVYAIALPADAARPAAAPTGPLQIPTGASLAGELAVMAMCATLAVTSTRRGWRALA